MTFPDRLPYGESNIPDAFAMYQGSRSVVTSTPGAENGVLRTRHAAWLPVRLRKQTAQSLQWAWESPGVPVLSHLLLPQTAGGELEGKARISVGRLI